jgi:hypothetical protein
MQSIRTAYGSLLAHKKEEVLGIVQQCMGDVHTLAGVGSRANDEVKKSETASLNTSRKLPMQQA